MAARQIGRACALFEVEVAPGGGEGPHVQHREDECLYVLEGRFGFTRESDRMEAGPGTHLYVPKGHMHTYSNVRTWTGRMLVLVTPGDSYEGFLEEAEGSAAGGGGPTPPRRGGDTKLPGSPR